MSKPIDKYTCHCYTNDDKDACHFDTDTLQSKGGQAYAAGKPAQGAARGQVAEPAAAGAAGGGVPPDHQPDRTGRLQPLHHAGAAHRAGV